jgi:hypothetical protein
VLQKGRAVTATAKLSGWFGDFLKLPLADRVSITLQALQVVAIIAGGAWFIFEYRTSVANKAKEESLKYAARAYSSDLIGDMAAIQKPFFDPALTQQRREALVASVKSKDICPIDIFYRKYITAAYYSNEIEKMEFYGRLSEVMEFYKSLSTSGTCDLTTACNFFFQDAKKLIGNHCTFLITPL